MLPLGLAHSYAPQSTLDATIAGKTYLTKSQTVSWSAPTPKGVTPDVLNSLLLLYDGDNLPG